MKTEKITNIQRFSIHDGKGIRTTVFFKGCPLACTWCHNPESQDYHKEFMVYRNRCTGCGRCVEECPEKAIVFDNENRPVTDRKKCTLCGRCMETCVNHVREISGKEYTVEELIKEIEKDQMFYEESGGGVTLSGGEVMTMDMDFIETLSESLYKLGYSVNIDTCGYVPYDNFERILPYVDTFLYDIKLIDEELHRKYTGCGNALILENARKLSNAGAKINIRLPLIVEVNANEAHISEVIAFLKGGVETYGINLLPYHNTGCGKYRSLDRSYSLDNSHVPASEWMEKTKHAFEENGYRNVKIGG